MRVLRVLLALLASAAVVLGLAPAPTARAGEPEALVRITLTGLSPALPARDGTVTVRGRVENVTDQPLYRLQAIFWRDQAPITTDEGVRAALASDSNVPIGARRTAYYQDLYAPADPYLAPGDTATFRITAPVADLQLSPTDGLYLMGVQVLQNGDTSAAAGRARTFVPVVTSTPAARLQMTSVVVLRSRPSQVRRGVFADDHLAREVRPGGRLDQLLEAADSDAVSFAVDPALVDELTTMRAGYTVEAADGGVTGTGQADASRWLQRFTAVEAARDGFQLLYGSPDVAALVHDRQTGVLDDAVAAGEQVSATASLPLLVMPGGGYADAPTLRAVEQLEPAAVLLSDASATGGVGPLLDVVGKAPVVTFSKASLGGGPGPDPRDTAVQVRQRVLADTWVQAVTATDTATRGRVRLVTATNQIQGDDAGVAAPWISRTTLSELLAGTAAAWDGTLSYPAVVRADELTMGQLATLAAFRRSWATYGELLVSPGVVEAAGQAAVARAASTTWRGHERQRSPWLETQQAALDLVLDHQLKISTNRKVSTIAQEGVVFPITIENMLPVDPDDPDANAVRLKLVFVSDNRQRLTIKPVEPVHDGVVDGVVRAGDNYTGNAQVTAKANGTVSVQAQLQTLAGTPVGEPQNIAVRVTQNGTTGWAIAAAALVLFGGGTALRIRQVNRGRNLTAAVDPPTALSSAPSALSSAPPRESPAASRPTEPPDHRDD